MYTHYKGARYRVLGLVRHSETEQWLVLYQALYGERGHWVRPLAMFMESVTVHGKAVPRFALNTATSAEAATSSAENLKGSTENFGEF
jgi:hypothetical protein